MNKLNLMQAYLAVYEEGSYTAAAKRLGKTKALISTQISQLEEHLQVSLVTRSTRSVKPTTAGKSYYEQCRQILDEISNLESRLKEQHHSLVGQLRISAPTNYGELIVMPFISGLIKKHPDLRIEIVLSDRYVDIVSEGFDAAIRIGNLSDSSLIASQVGQVQMHLCASAEFLATFGTPQSIAELNQYPCVFDSNYRHNYWQFPTAQGEITVTPTQSIRVNSAVAAAQIARNHSVLSYGPDFAVAEYIRKGELVTLLDNQFDNCQPVNIIYPHRKHLSARVRTFITEFKEYLSGTYSG